MTDEKKKRFLRKPSFILWTATIIVISYAVWCVLLLILTASGHLLNSQSFECLNSTEDAYWLKKEARLVCLWTGISLPVCILLLLEFWRRKVFYAKVLQAATIFLFLIMIHSSRGCWKEETQELKDFEKRYLALQPLTDAPGNAQNQLNDTTCHILNNVHRWQAEFKCCGLQGYQDWESSIPDSCLCGREDRNSGCVGVGNSLVHGKPCLPTVLSLVKQRSTTFGVVIITWITIVGIPAVIFMLYAVLPFVMCVWWVISVECYYKLSVWKYKMSGGEEMVPVVFIRKNNNNNQTGEENGKEGEAKERGWCRSLRRRRRYKCGGRGTRSSGRGLV